MTDLEPWRIVVVAGLTVAGVATGCLAILAVIVRAILQDLRAKIDQDGEGAHAAHSGTKVALADHRGTVTYMDMAETEAFQADVARMANVILSANIGKRGLPLRDTERLRTAMLDDFERLAELRLRRGPPPKEQIH